MADIVLTVTPSSHPDYDLFGSLTLGGKQVRAFRCDLIELSDRIDTIEKSFDKAQKMRKDAGKRPLTMEVLHNY